MGLEFCANPGYTKTGIKRYSYTIKIFYLIHELER